MTQLLGRQPMHRRGAMTFWLIAVFGRVAFAADWPGWRGPDRDGIAPAMELQLTWPAAGPDVVWRAEVGVGFSSFAVANGRAYTLGNTADIDTLWCLAADSGEVLWQGSYAAPLDPNLFEGGPTATPTVSGDTVFTFSRTGLAIAWDAATGEERWRTNVAEACGVNVPSWGFAGSPVVWNDTLLLTAGSAGVALNQRSGDIVWKSDNSDDAGYATPVLTTLHEQSLALILSGKAIHAVDPATGTPRWEHRWITRYGVNAADPLLSGTDLFLSSGYAKGSSLLRISPTGAEEVWRTRDLRNQLSPGVLIDGHVYAVDGDAGEDCRLKCVEAATGVVRWEAEGLGSASLIACGPRLIILTGTGELVVDEVDSAAFRPLARAQILEGKCWTPPAFSDGRLYCRNAAGNVVCLDLRPQRLVGAASPRVNRAR